MKSPPRCRHRRASEDRCNIAAFNRRLVLFVLCFWSFVTFLPVQAFFHSPTTTKKVLCRIKVFSLSPTGSVQPPLPASNQRLRSALHATAKDDGYDGLGEYDPSEGISPEREVVVGDPQIRLKEKERSVTSILKELAAIQQQGPQKYCILGTRHCSYLHQQIIELLYVLALVLFADALFVSGTLKYLLVPGA